MNTLYAWLRKHIYVLFTLFLLVFIPLYPKLPLIDVQQTWVYIRIEDFLVAVVALLVSIKVYKQRDSINSYITKPIIIYWFIGALSVVVSIVFIGPKLISYHPSLVLLHFGRRIEYMMLFFLGLLAVRSKVFSLKTFLIVLVGSILAVVLYGVGQKYAGFPAFLTMNEEFAKGVPLRLPPTARIASTFAGHYDLAAYLVLMLPILGSLALGVKNIWTKLLLLLVGMCSLAILLFTASRVSFGVYLVSISVMLWWSKKKWLIPIVVVGSIILMQSVSGASERFTKTLRVSEVIVDMSTGKPIGTLEKRTDGSVVVENQERPDEETLPKGSGFINVPSTQQDSSVGTISYYKSKPLSEGRGEIATISGSFLIEKALVYDISLTTRFQGQWPKALEAFRRNILLGSGYSTLNLAVDGWYMRLLGETGLLGAIGYLGILSYGVYGFFVLKPKLGRVETALVIGYFSGLIGLLLNAILIDVFEASKLAFVFWLLTGVVVGIMTPHLELKHNYVGFLWASLTHKISLSLYLLIAVFVWFGGGVGTYFVGDDFTWLRWATNAHNSEFLGYFTQADGFFYRPIPKIAYALLYTIFWLSAMGYHVVSFLLFGTCAILIYSIAKKLRVSTFVSFMIALWFTTLSIHHENVFWISGLSSLMATVFSLGAIRVALAQHEQHGFKNWLSIGLGIKLLALAISSYEPVLPIIFIYIAILRYYKKVFRVEQLIPLLLLGGYWYLRTMSGAVGATGDYGFKTSTFIVNSIANVLAYLTSIFVGPQAIDWWTHQREALRGSMALVAGVSTVMGIVFVAVVYKTKSVLLKNHEVLLWILITLMSFVPVMGLGAATDRYALFPSACLAIVFAIVLRTFWAQGKRILTIVLLGILGGTMITNVGEVTRLGNDWKFAGNITEQTLLRVKTEFKTVDVPKKFLFVNTPIRYGRAWVFPTGLTDAFWHVYRLSPFPVTIYQFPTLKEAFAFAQVYREVFIFENFEIKRAFEEQMPAQP